MESKKIELCGYRAEKFDDIFSRLDTIRERDGRTDTGVRMTAKTALTHSVAR